MDQPIPFKMFGLQRTGTNLAVALMRQNFHVHSLEIGAEWKHGPVRQTDRHWNGIPARFILCVKNPHAWMLSCYRYFKRAWRADGTVAEQFKRDPKMSFETFATTAHYEFATPVDRWNVMYRRWLAELPADRTALIRQEDQLTDAAAVLLALERQLGLRRKGEKLEGIDRHVDINAAAGGPMDYRYYLERRYLAEYTEPMLNAVAASVDAELMARFEYELS